MTARILGCALVSTEEHLARERQFGPRAAIAAVLAGILTLAGGFYPGVVFRDAPHTHFLNALDDVVKTGPIGDLPSRLIPIYRFYSEHDGGFVISGVLNALGTAGVG